MTSTTSRSADQSTAGKLASPYQAAIIAAVSGAVQKGILYLFEHRPLKLYLINGGYCMLALMIMGGILGLWT